MTNEEIIDSWLRFIRDKEGMNSLEQFLNQKLSLKLKAMHIESLTNDMLVHKLTKPCGKYGHTITEKGKKIISGTNTYSTFLNDLAEKKERADKYQDKQEAKLDIDIKKNKWDYSMRWILLLFAFAGIIFALLALFKD